MTLSKPEEVLQFMSGGLYSSATHTHTHTVLSFGMAAVFPKRLPHFHTPSVSSRSLWAFPTFIPLFPRKGPRFSFFPPDAGGAVTGSFPSMPEACSINISPKARAWRLEQSRTSREYAECVYVPKNH